MPLTILYDEPFVASAAAIAFGDDLWLPPEDLHAATGWEHKAQGVCRGDRCVPLPPARKAEFVDAENRFNLTTFARYLDWAVAHDDAAGVWAFGEAATTQREALRAGVAPDFRLPDLDGELHALSDYRGSKVLLLSWASW